VPHINKDSKSIKRVNDVRNDMFWMIYHAVVMRIAVLMATI